MANWAPFSEWDGLFGAYVTEVSGFPGRYRIDLDAASDDGSDEIRISDIELPLYESFRMSIVEEGICFNDPLTAEEQDPNSYLLSLSIYAEGYYPASGNYTGSWSADWGWVDLFVQNDNDTPKLGMATTPIVGGALLSSISQTGLFDFGYDGGPAPGVFTIVREPGVPDSDLTDTVVSLLLPTVREPVSGNRVTLRGYVVIQLEVDQDTAIGGGDGGGGDGGGGAGEGYRLIAESEIDWASAGAGFSWAGNGRVQLQIGDWQESELPLLAAMDLRLTVESADWQIENYDWDGATVTSGGYINIFSYSDGSDAVGIENNSRVGDQIYSPDGSSAWDGVATAGPLSVEAIYFDQPYIQLQNFGSSIGQAGGTGQVTLLLEVVGSDGGGGEGSCFWTDYADVTEMCGGAPPGPAPQAVDGILLYQTLWDGAKPMAETAWRGDAERLVLADPATPAAADSSLSAPLLGTLGITNMLDIRNATFGDNVYYFQNGEGVYDELTHRLRTDGVVTINTSFATGGSGSYSMGHLFPDISDYDGTALYNELPEEFKYPSWMAEKATVIPPRRRAAMYRNVAKINSAEGASFTSMRVFLGTDQVDISMPVTSPSTYTQSSWGLIGYNDFGAPHLGPVENDTYRFGALYSWYGPTIYYYPGSTAKSVQLDMEAWHEVVVGEPAPIGGYLTNIEVFSNEGDPTVLYGFDNMPPPGTGVAYGDTCRIPVAYLDSYDGTYGEWVMGIGLYEKMPGGGASMEIWAGDVLVGDLYDSSDTFVCRYAVMIKMGGDA